MGTIPDEGLLYDYNVRKDEFHVFVLFGGQLWPLIQPVSSQGFDDEAISDGLRRTMDHIGFVTGLRELESGRFIPKVTLPDGQMIVSFSMLHLGEQYELVVGQRGNSSVANKFASVVASRGATVPPPRGVYSTAMPPPSASPSLLMNSHSMALGEPLEYGAPMEGSGLPPHAALSYTPPPLATGAAQRQSPPPRTTPHPHPPQEHSPPIPPPPQGIEEHQSIATDSSAPSLYQPRPSSPVDTAYHR